MPLSRDDLSRQLADLEAAVPGLVEEHEDEALEVIACMGDDIASQAGPECCWVEDQVEAILLRYGLIES